MSKVIASFFVVLIAATNIPILLGLAACVLVSLLVQVMK